MAQKPREERVSEGSTASVKPKRRKTKRRPVNLVIEWSEIVLNGDSITKLYLLCVSYRDCVYYVVSGRLGLFRPWAKTLPISYEWGGLVGVRKAGYSARTMKLRKQAGERRKDG